MITIILPTYNEKDNLPVLVKSINSLGIDLKLVIVDDNSPDGTGTVADNMAKKYSNIKVFHRLDERGLGSAIKFGFEKADTDVVGVMDTDLSHGPSVLPDVIKRMKEGSDFVVCSRYAEGGGIRDWTFLRKLVSRIATLMVKPLSGIKDPMSGFFFAKKEVINSFDINPDSCKICLDIIVRGKYRKAVEVPYTFTNRKSGKTKILTAKEIMKYIRYIMHLYWYRIKALLTYRRLASFRCQPPNGVSTA